VHVLVTDFFRSGPLRFCFSFADRFFFDRAAILVYYAGLVFVLDAFCFLLPH